MGILNVTPDSFANGAQPSPARALDLALSMEAAGADLLDIGGESTRPNAAAVSLEDELARVLPVLALVAAHVRIPVSIDTYKAGVARASLDTGASIINDVSGLLYDQALGAVVASGGAALVLMHTRGRSADMYASADYDDVCDEVSTELIDAIARAEAAGVPRESIVVDPGIGFAKRPEHSYGVLAGLPVITRRVGRPVLVGPSRKSFMSVALEGRAAAERDWGTAAAVTAAVLAGAHIVRVHAVDEMVQVVRVAEEIRRQATRVQ